MTFLSRSTLTPKGERDLQPSERKSTKNGSETCNRRKRKRKKKKKKKRKKAKPWGGSESQFLISLIALNPTKKEREEEERRERRKLSFSLSSIFSQYVSHCFILLPPMALSLSLSLSFFLSFSLSLLLHASWFIVTHSLASRVDSFVLYICERVERKRGARRKKYSIQGTSLSVGVRERVVVGEDWPVFSLSLSSSAYYNY